MAKLALNYSNIRSHVLGFYVSSQGKKGAICFQHPHAAEEMQKLWPGIKVLRIMKDGDLDLSNKWWSREEIAYIFDDFVDITPGNLPVVTMLEIAREIRAIIGPLDTDTIYEVDCESGEEIIALQLAYPRNEFVACFDEAQTPQTPLSKFILEEFTSRPVVTLK